MQETLTAGRELDAIIALKVMGAVYEPKGGYNQRDGHYGLWRFPSGMTRDEFKGPPRYSTDIGAAWQVVGRLEADGWAYKVEQVTREDGTKAHRAVFARYPADLAGHIANTPQEAICLAALKAIEGTHTAP